MTGNLYFAKRHFQAIWPELFLWFRYKRMPVAGKSAKQNARLALQYLFRGIEDVILQLCLPRVRVQDSTTAQE